MTNQITITLSDDVYKRAENFARLANRDLASVLADTIQFGILSMSTIAASFEPISAISNEQVMALTELQMEYEQDARLSELLAQQQAGFMIEIEYSELQALMQIYQELLLRKATALSEAVKRGLMEPLNIHPKTS